IETFAGPEAAAGLTTMGLDQLVIQAGVGVGEDRTFGAMRARGFVPMARQNGSLPSGPIARRAFDVIPEDATVAMLGRTSFDAVLDGIRKAAPMQPSMDGGADPVAMVGGMLGLDLDRDVFDNLGETYG